MSSTTRGESGREYITEEILRRWPQNPELKIYRAVTQKEFAESQHLRMHVDHSNEERALVYEYYQHTFLALLSQYPNFPATEVKKILRCTAEAVKELHDKDWIHIDVKPDNILVDWAYNERGEPKVSKVALGDFDLALKIVDDRPLRAPHAVGNVMWRSPEGQSGKGIAKASDIYSLGLVCIYGLGGGSMIIMDDDLVEGLRENGLPPELEIVVRHFMFFGPLPEGLLRHVDDGKWTELFQSASEIAETEAAENPDNRFGRWSAKHATHLTPEAKDMISRMTRLDPAERANIDEILQHTWW